MSEDDFFDPFDFDKFMWEKYGIGTSHIDLSEINWCPVCGDQVVPVEEKTGYYIIFLDEVLDYEGKVYKCSCCDFEADQDNWFDHFQHGLPGWM